MRGTIADPLTAPEAARKAESMRGSIGDRKQLGAVDAGKPFDIMQQAGIETATMNINLPSTR
jgi:hypothetical protein